MNNLNKQNYFNEAWLAMYPYASKDFCRWIDEFKKDKNWRSKFHDLPLMEQYAVLSIYFNKFNNNFWLRFQDREEMIKQSNYFFKLIDERIRLFYSETPAETEKKIPPPQNM